MGRLPAEAGVVELQRELPIYTSPMHGPDGLPVLRVWHSPQNGRYCFQYSEGITFVLDGRCHGVWAQWNDGTPEQLVNEYLASQTLSFILHLRGYVCVHASAVVIDGRAVLFAGPQGSGKSSTAAAFAQRGRPVLSDDISPIGTGPGGQLVVMPGLPRVSLWPDSTEFLYGRETARRLPRLLEQEEKRFVRLDGPRGKYQQEPAPLGAVYLLAQRNSEPSAPRIEPLGMADRLVQLLPSGFVSSALDSERRGREFQIQGEISRRVPVQRLVPSSDPAKLDRLCDLVLNDVRAMNFSLANSID